MTAFHLLAVASFIGALLFFIAGATSAALWRTRRLAVPEPVIDDQARIHAATLELEAARDRATHAERTGRERIDEVGQLRHELERARATTTDRANARNDEIEHLRRELASARTAHQQARTSADELAVRIASEAERLADAEARAKHLGSELDRARSGLAREEARGKQLAAELDRARSSSAAAGTDVEHLESRARDAERQLADRSLTVRDLASENEQLKGRVNDAEALRAEYVRLRTTVTETSFLKAEVARLEEQIRSMRRDAMGAATPRRAPAAPAVRPTGSIGESLSATLDRFADSHTRGSAIADALGFPLASRGEDGNALAAYAALLLESANRASQLLPMANPSAIELVDERGARISVWTFEVERERLVLVNLAVAPVDGRRVESTLAELRAILAPSLLEGSAR
jgi:hypothetical protein